MRLGSKYRWACPQCGKHNHAKLKRCRKCGHSMWANWPCLVCNGHGVVSYGDLVKMSNVIPDLVPDPGEPFAGGKTCPVCLGKKEDPEMGIREWVWKERKEDTE